MIAEIQADHRDVVQVTEEGHRHHGRRFLVISGHAGIGSRYIHACAEGNHAERVGLRHDQVEIVGQLAFGEPMPVI